MAKIKNIDWPVFPECDDVIMTSSLLFTKLIQIMKRLLIMDSSRSEVAKNGIICQNRTTQTLKMSLELSSVLAEICVLVIIINDIL